MNKTAARFIVSALIVSIMVSACASPAPEVVLTPTQVVNVAATSTALAQATEESFVKKYKLAVVSTDDEQFGVMAAHVNRERLVAMTDYDQSGSLNSVTGAVWYSPDNSSFVVFSGADGLPEKVVVEHFVFLFSNYTDTTVDVSVVSPDGKFEAFRNAAIDSDQLNELRGLAQGGSTSRNSDHVVPISYKSTDIDTKALLKTLKWASLVVSIAACVAVGITTTAVTFGAALAALAIPCGSAILSAVSLLVEDTPYLVGAGAFFGSLGCIWGSVADCIIALVDTTTTVADVALVDSSKAENIQESILQNSDASSTSSPTSSTSNSRPILHLNKNFYCRTGPDSSFPDVTGFYSGTELPIIGQYNGWYLVEVDVQSKFKSCWIGGGEVLGDVQSIPTVTPKNLPSNNAGNSSSNNKPNKPPKNYP